MKSLQETPPDPDKPVLVFMESDQATRQPPTFSCCPLGIQLYTNRPVAEFAVMDVRLDVPNEDGHLEEITCAGIVVYCEEDTDRNLYRVCLKFADLPADAMERIRSISVDRNHKCPYCENY